jgi:CelD/BcsL family acetyltransferase involved in cellulose biosynthesis
MSAAARALSRDLPQVEGQDRSAVHQFPSPVQDQRPVFDLVQTFAGFEALEAEWNSLFERAGTDRHLFQTFNWLWHWANHFLPRDTDGAGVRLAIVTTRVADRLVMIWPLVVERSGPVTELAWMGEPVSQYGDLLIEDGPDALAMMREAWAFVTRETGADVLRLRKVRQDSKVAPFLAELGATVTSDLKAPYLDIGSAPSFAEYEKRYSSNAKRNRKRQRRRLEDRGPVSLTWLEGGAEAEAFTEQAFRFKHVWLRQRGIVSPALTDPRTAQFFADVTRADIRPAGCHVLALKCNDQPVALEIGVKCLGRSAIHIIAYDPEFEKTAAGALLMEDSIRRACDDGLKVFDMLAPGDGYKLEWADDAVGVRDWAKPVTLLGRAYVTVYVGLVRNGLKRAIGALPLGMRRALTELLASWTKPKS